MVIIELKIYFYYNLVHSAMTHTMFISSYRYSYIIINNFKQTKVKVHIYIIYIVMRTI